MPRPNMLLESLGAVGPPYLRQRYDPCVADNYDPDRECPHKPWQTYTKYPCSCGRELWPPRGRGRGESLTSPRRLKAKKRVIEAMRLRAQGYTFRAIAEKLGYSSRKTAWRAVRRCIDQAQAIRNWEQWRRENGGRPHYPRPSPEEGKRILAELEAARESDRRMHAERIAVAEEQLARMLG
jgi:hypothetical protein